MYVNFCGFQQMFGFILFIIIMFCHCSCVCGNIDDVHSLIMYDRAQVVGYWRTITPREVIFLLVIMVIIFLAFYFVIRRVYRRGRQEGADQGGIELQPVVISPMEVNQFPLHTYGEGEGAYHGEKCSICLTDFVRGEELRSYPRCTHVFHMQCIEGNIRAGNRTCPLCRSHIPVFRKTAVAVVADDETASLVVQPEGT